MESLKGWIKITRPKSASASITYFKTKHLSISYSEQLSQSSTHNWPAFCIFGSGRHSVLFSSLKQRKERGSLCVRTCLKYLYRACVGSCPGTEPVTAVCSCTCENPQHAWPPIDRQVGALRTNKRQSYDRRSDKSSSHESCYTKPSLQLLNFKLI